MSDPAPRRGPAPHKDREVLWAAARLFAERGVAHVTTREIAAAARTTERTLFKHFGSKDALIHAVIAQAVVPHVAPGALRSLRELITAYGDDFPQWHRALLQARLRALSEAPELTRLLVVELLRDEALRARFAEQWLGTFWKPLLALLSHLRRERLLRDDLPVKSLARMFLSLNLGFLLGRLVLAPDARWDEQREIDAIVTAFADAARYRPRAAARG